MNSELKRFSTVRRVPVWRKGGYWVLSETPMDCLALTGPQAAAIFREAVATRFDTAKKAGWSLNG